VNIASMSAYKAEKETVLYSMTKAAVLAFSRVLAFELVQYNVRVVSISPGNVRTPIIDRAIHEEASLRKVDEKVVEQAYDWVSMLHRMATPDEIAKVVLFAVSDMASFVTGSDIAVDGGSIAKSYEVQSG
jgi:meso-butanediol dehydrogenase / (S,S)-butanediol dehydrogenase / diacetyl reductase